MAKHRSPGTSAPLPAHGTTPLPPAPALPITPPPLPAVPAASYSSRFYRTAMAIGTMAFAAVAAIGGCLLYNAGYNSCQDDIRKTPIVEKLETFSDGSEIYIGIKRLDGTAEGARTQDGRVWRTYSGIQKKALEWDDKAGRYFEQQSLISPEILKPVPYPSQNQMPSAPLIPIHPPQHPIDFQQDLNLDKKLQTSKIAFLTQGDLEEMAEIEFTPAKQPRQIIIIK